MPAAQRATETASAVRPGEDAPGILTEATVTIFFMRTLAAMFLAMTLDTIFPIKEFFGAILIPALAKWLGLPPPGRFY